MPMVAFSFSLPKDTLTVISRAFKWAEPAIRRAPVAFAEHFNLHDFGVTRAARRECGCVNVHAIEPGTTLIEYRSSLSVLTMTLFDFGVGGSFGTQF